MEISTASNIVTISGNIKTIQDFQDITVMVNSLITKEKSIVIKVLNSLSMTSSLIGYLNKIILKDKIRVTMYVANEQLVHLLDDLGLTQLFNVKKV